MIDQTSNELRQFHGFVAEKLAKNGTDLSPEAVLIEWRSEHPSRDELMKSAADVRDALDEADRGEGALLDDVVAALRRKYQLPCEGDTR